MFKEIWNEREHKSFVSGELLGHYAKPHFFAHVLSKGAYPRYRLNKDNIVLLTMEEHYLFDHGSMDQRDKTGLDWQPLYDLKDELKIKYYEEQ
jgi:hypothetical protein